MDFATVGVAVAPSAAAFSSDDESALSFTRHAAADGEVEIENDEEGEDDEIVENRRQIKVS